MLALEGRSVTRCSVAYDFDLLLDGDDDDASTVHISLVHFRFRDTEGREYVLDAEGDRRLLAPALACFGLTVAHAYAYKTGRLELAFTDGSQIEADPHAQYEAWQVSGPGTALVVSPADGDEPAVWDGTGGFEVSLDEVRRMLGDGTVEGHS